MLYHLAWHYSLQRDTLADAPWTDALWACPPIAASTALSLAALVRRIWRRSEQNGIPYAVAYGGQQFDGTGVLRLGPGTTGLTCATFVLAVFEEQGVHLLSIESWEPREGDDVWHATIVDVLQRTGADAAHVEAVRRERGCARFRPLDVLAAAAGTELPISFEVASERTAVLVERLYGQG